jgi:hypothetical protein
MELVPSESPGMPARSDNYRFHVRMHPMQPADVISRLEQNSPENRRALNRLRSHLLSKGIQASTV